MIAYRDGGLQALAGRKPSPRPTSELAAHADAIRRSLTARPVRTTAEAIERIESLTGLRRGLTQTRTFLAGLGFRWQRTRAVPVPPKSRGPNTSPPNRRSSTPNCDRPWTRPSAGPSMSCSWTPPTSCPVPSCAACGRSCGCSRAASGRQRFHVLGAWNPVTRRLLSVTNTTVVNTETRCQRLRVIAAEGLVGPVTVVLDNARYQRNKAVQGLAAELDLRLLFLPSYSPNLNLIERLWGFAKRRSVYGTYTPTSPPSGLPSNAP